MPMVKISTILQYKFNMSLINVKKAEISYDALPHYYIKNMKEAHQTPIEIPLEEFMNYALNTEEASVNPGTDAKGKGQFQ
jgi:hypothetical protein